MHDALRCCCLEPLRCFGLVFGHASAFGIHRTCHQQSAISDQRLPPVLRIARPTRTEIVLRARIALRCCRGKPLRGFRLIFGHASALIISDTCRDQQSAGFCAVPQSARNQSTNRDYTAPERYPAPQPPQTTSLLWPHLWPRRGLCHASHLQNQHDQSAIRYAQMQSSHEPRLCCASASPFVAAAESQCAALDSSLVTPPPVQNLTPANRIAISNQH